MCRQLMKLNTCTLRKTEIVVQAIHILNAVSCYTAYKGQDIEQEHIVKLPNWYWTILAWVSYPNIVCCQYIIAGKPVYKRITVDTQ